MLKGRLLRGGLWLTAGGVLSAALSFVRNVAIARLVSVEDFGIVVLLSLALAVVETVSNLAIDRLLVQASDGDDPRLQATAHALQVARGFVGSAFVFFTAGWVAALFKIPQATWALELLALVPLIRSFAHLDTVRVQRQLSYSPTFWVDVAPQFLSVVISIPLAYLLRDFSAIVWAMLAQALAHGLMTHALASRPYRWAWDRLQLRRILTFGWPLLANGLLMFAIFHGDKALIAVAFNPEVVGWYGAAFMLSLAPATVVISAMQRLLLPVLSVVQDSAGELRRRYELAIHTSLIVSLVVAAAFGVFGYEMLTVLFGERYRAGGEVVAILGITQAIRIAKGGQFVFAIAVANTKIPMIANLARGFSLFVAVSVVTLGFDATAVAVVGLVGEMLSYALAVKLIRRSMPIVLPQGIWPAFAWMLFAGFSWAVGSTLRHLDLQILQIVLGLSWILFATVTLSACSPQFRAELRKQLRRWRKAVVDRP